MEQKKPNWDELELIRGSDGYLMVKDIIKELDESTKTFRDIKVSVRIPRPKDCVQARIDVRIWFKSLSHLDPEKDKDLFDELEQICLLAKAIRDPETGAQLVDAQELWEKYEENSLQHLLEKLNVYRQMLDPRPSLLTEEDILRKVVEVAQAGHLLPLTGIAGREQPSFMLSMAVLAVTSPMVQSWLQSQETLTQGGSPEKTS